MYVHPRFQKTLLNILNKNKMLSSVSFTTVLHYYYCLFFKLLVLNM